MLQILKTKQNKEIAMKERKSYAEVEPVKKKKRKALLGEVLSLLQ